MKTFADRLKTTRRRHGLTQAEAAALVPKLSLRTLQHWEVADSEPPEWAQGLVLHWLEDSATKLSAANKVSLT